MVSLNADKKNVIRLSVSLFVGFLLLIVLVWWTGIDKLWSAIRGVSPLWIMASALTIFPAYFFRALRWKFLLLPIKNSIRIGNAFWSTAIGFMVNTLIPIRLGEFVRAYVLGEKENVGFAPSFSSIVVERILDLIGLLTLGLLALFMLPADTTMPNWVLDGFKVVGALICLMLAFIGLSVKKEAVSYTHLTLPTKA